MSEGPLIAVAVLFGLAVGAAFTLLIRAALDRARIAAEQEEERLPDGVAPVLTAMALPALVVNGSNTVLIATPSAVELGLVERDELVHAELDDLADECRAAQAVREAEFVLHRRRVGPANLDVFAHAAPLGPRAVLLLVEDRSDARRLESVRRDFVANVSHELKTPIGAVGLLAEALTEAADEPVQVRRFASRLSSEASRLGTITRDIIDFSRLQTHEPLEAPREVSIDEVLSASVDRSRVAADARSIDLVLGKRTGLVVLGDHDQLVTAVHNLVSNAVQYSPDGARVGIGARVRDGVVEVSITDQGMGIGEEDLERVFERFYRSDPARSRGTGGTGLGLSIVKHVAEHHGGTVAVWSQLGRGSTFTLRLPLLPAPAADDTAGTRRREKERV